MGSSGGASSQVVQYVPVETAAAKEPEVIPAVAKTISRDTSSAQVTQLRERQRMSGIASTYENARKKQDAGSGNATLGGN